MEKMRQTGPMEAVGGIMDVGQDGKTEILDDTNVFIVVTVYATLH